MNTTIEPVSVLIKKSLDLVKANWKNFAYFIIVSIGISIIFFLSVSIIRFIVVFSGAMISGNQTPPAILTIILSFIETLFSLLLVGIFSFSSAKFVSCTANRENVSPWQIIKPFILDYRQVFVTSLLASALLYGGMIIIVPAVFFYYGTILYIYTAGIEGKRGLSALIQSYWYTNNKKAHLFGKLLSIYGLTFLMIIVYMIVLGIVSVAIASLKIASVTIITVILAALLTITLLFWLISVLQVSMYEIYIQLKKQAPEVVDPVFFEDKKNKFKIFIGIGFVLIAIITTVKPFMPDKNQAKNSNNVTTSTVYSIKTE